MPIIGGNPPESKRKRLRSFTFSATSETDQDEAATAPRAGASADVAANVPGAVVLAQTEPETVAIPAKHPSSNRGVVRAADFALMDWLRCYKRCSYQEFTELRELLAGVFKSTGESAFKGHGMSGVEIAAHGSLTWRFDRRSDEWELLAELPGQALEHARRDLGVDDQGLCSLFVTLGFQANRFDGAIDVRDEAVTPRMVYEWADPEKQLLVCEAAKRQWIESDDLHSGDPYGTTCYFGSRSSSRFMRVYDKVREKWAKQKLKLVDENGAEITHLTRFEIELKDEAATDAMHLMALQGVSAIGDIFRGWIDFKSPKSARRYSRVRDAESAMWWRRIVGKGVRHKPGLHHASTPEKTLAWLSDSVAPAISLAREFGMNDQLEEAIKVAPVRAVKRKQWAAWRDAETDDRERGVRAYAAAVAKRSVPIPQVLFPVDAFASLAIQGR